MRNGLFKLSILLSCFVGWLSFCPIYSSAQGIRNDGANIVVSGEAHIYINEGGWLNNGTFTRGNSTVAFAGATAQSIAGTNSTAFYSISAFGAGTKTFNTASTIERLVTVDGAVLNANGKLTLLADALTNASVGEIKNSGSVTNNVIVQSYLTGGYRTFKGLSSPINDAAVTGDKTYKQLQSKLIITGPGGSNNGFDMGNSLNPHAVTIKTYNESAAKAAPQFTNIASIGESTTPGKGFFLFYRGNRIDDYVPNGVNAPATGDKIEGPNWATPESVTVEFTGPINQNGVNVVLSYTDHPGDNDAYVGNNLVGNPYPSVIDWHEVLNNSSSSISPGIHLLTQDGRFATYSEFVGTGTLGGSRYIMPGQAFYVLATSSTPQTLSFPASCKEPYPASGTVMRFLSAPNKDNSITMSKGGELLPSDISSPSVKLIRLNVQSADSKEEAVIAFMDGTTPAYNAIQDVLYRAGGPLLLSTRSSDDKNLAINTLPEFTEASEIKLYVAAVESEKLTLNVTDLSGLAGAQLFLEDAYLNRIQSVNENPSYSFEINSKISSSYGAKRLKLIFKPVIKLSTFSAKKVYGGSEINWVDLKDNTNIFTIERSADGSVFSPIGSVSRGTDPSGKHIYTDSNPKDGINYYRLKLHGLDSTYSYTNVVSLEYKIDADEPAFRIYPNPVKNTLNVLFKEKAKRAQLTIFNLNGQKLKSFTVLEANQASQELGDLETGVYVLKVVDGLDKEIGTEKFIKD